MYHQIAPSRKATVITTKMTRRSLAEVVAPRYRPRPNATSATRKMIAPKNIDEIGSAGPAKLPAMTERANRPTRDAAAASRVRLFDWDGEWFGKCSGSGVFMHHRKTVHSCDSLSSSI